MWVETNREKAFDGGPFNGKREKFRISNDGSHSNKENSVISLLDIEKLSFPLLPKCEVTPPVVKELINETDNTLEENAHNKGGFIDVSDNSVNAVDEDEEVFRQIYPGGILVELPWIITVGVKVNARVSWVPSAGASDDGAMSGSDNRNSNNNSGSKNEIINI